MVMSEYLYDVSKFHGDALKDLITKELSKEGLVSDVGISIAVESDGDRDLVGLFTITSEKMANNLASALEVFQSLEVK